VTSAKFLFRQHRPVSTVTTATPRCTLWDGTLPLFSISFNFGVVGDDAFVIFEHKSERLAPEQRRKHGAPSSVREPGIIARFIACSSATFTRTAS
jgi:hypothetical protein